MTVHNHQEFRPDCYWCRVPKGDKARTPAQTHTTAPQSDEPPTDAHPNRLPSAKPADSHLDKFTHHATEAERLAGSTAGLVHAHLANAYALLAQQEQS